MLEGWIRRITWKIKKKNPTSPSKSCLNIWSDLGSMGRMKLPSPFPLCTLCRFYFLCIDCINILEKAMAPHSCTLAWKIPWTEEPGRLQSMGSLKSRTWLSDFTLTFRFHALEKEMATHSSVLAWRIPGTGEPGGLPSMGSHRVGHDWSNLSSSSSSIVAM